MDRIRPGVFFRGWEELPRGRHGLTREAVKAVQRERLLASATELLAAQGYDTFGVPHVARRARVSLAAFYELFDNKQACVFEGYDRFISVLLTRVTGVSIDGLDAGGLTSRLLGAYLDTLQSDPVVARAYQVEIDALGRAARQRRRESLSMFAQYLAALVRETDPELGLRVDLPQSAYLGVVYAARQLASDALDTSTTPDLDGLADDLMPWIRVLFEMR